MKETGMMANMDDVWHMMMYSDVHLFGYVCIPPSPPSVPTFTKVRPIRLCGGLRKTFLKCWLLPSMISIFAMLALTTASDAPNGPEQALRARQSEHTSMPTDRIVYGYVRV